MFKLLISYFFNLQHFWSPFWQVKTKKIYSSHIFIIIMKSKNMTFIRFLEEKVHIIYIQTIFLIIVLCPLDFFRCLLIKYNFQSIWKLTLYLIYRQIVLILLSMSRDTWHCFYAVLSSYCLLGFHWV